MKASFVSGLLSSSLESSLESSLDSSFEAFLDVSSTETVLLVSGALELLSDGLLPPQDARMAMSNNAEAIVVIDFFMMLPLFSFNSSDDAFDITVESAASGVIHDVAIGIALI